jgi:hypothetical protein
MTKSRASIFGESSGLDLSGFKPRSNADAKAPSAEAVKVVAESANFHSREGKSAPVTTSAPKRLARRYRTGRNVQFTAKALQETIDAIYAVSDAQGWVLGYTLERAVAALQRELAEAP